MSSKQKPPDNAVEPTAPPNVPGVPDSDTKKNPDFSHEINRIRDWGQFHHWFTVFNAGLFGIIILILVNGALWLGSELSDKGERLALVEERLRQIESRATMPGNRD